MRGCRFPDLGAVFVLILCAFQLLCQPSQVHIYNKSWVELSGSFCPLWSALFIAFICCTGCMCVTLGNFHIRYLSPVPLTPAGALQWRLPFSPFLGPRCLCRDRMNLLQWRGTEPTHKEGILGVSAKKFSLQSLFFCYHNSRLLFPCPLHTVSHRDKRSKISPLGFGLNTLRGGIVSKKHVYLHLALFV